MIKGIDFLQDGIRYNEHEPILLWDMGWIISQKIGKADEVKQFRRLFKDDDDFHGSRPLAERDNWLVGKQWFREACRRVDAGERINKTPVLFRSEPAMCQMHYCEAIEKDGTFGEVAEREWRNAAAEWKAFGDEDIPTSDKTVIHLNDEELYRDKYAQCLDKIDPGGALRAKIEAELRAELTDGPARGDRPGPQRPDHRAERAGGRGGTAAALHGRRRGPPRHRRRADRGPETGQGGQAIRRDDQPHRRLAADGELQVLAAAGRRRAAARDGRRAAVDLPGRRGLRSGRIARRQDRLPAADWTTGTR